jgi:hypothetical protein
MGQFFANQLGLRLIDLLSDPYESVRDTAIDTLSACMTFLESRDTSRMVRDICCAILKRFDDIRIESCEEIRVKLVNLLKINTHKHIQTFNEYNKVLLDCITKAVEDPCPEVKRLACDVILELRNIQNDSVSKPPESLITALIANSTHQHWRVRKSTVQALEIVMDMGSPPFISSDGERIIPTFSMLCADRSHQVRVVAVDVLTAWLMCLDSSQVISCKLFYLLSGCIFDESEEVISHVTHSIDGLSNRITPDTNNLRIARIFDGARQLSLGVVAEFFSSYACINLFSIHSKRCIDLALHELSSAVDEAQRLQAGRSMVLFAAHAPGPKVESLITAVSKLLPDYPLLEMFPPLLSIAVPTDDLIPIITKHLQLTIQKQGIPLGKGLLQFLHLMTHRTISEELIKCLHVASFWPLLTDSAVQIMMSCLPQEDALPAATREKLFTIALRCSANGSHSSQIFALLGSEIFDDYFGSQLGQIKMNDDTSRYILRELIRNASLTRSVNPSINNTLVPLFRVENSDSIEIRLDVLEMVHLLIQRGALVPNDMLTKVVYANLLWRPGQANSKLRKVALVCLFEYLKTAVVESSVLESYWEGLKSCMDDSWSPDNRLLAVGVVTAAYRQGSCIKDLEIEILRRLDDSQDEIRIAAASLISLVFEHTCNPTGLIQALLIHLDDPSMSVASEVARALHACPQKDLVNNEIKDLLGKRKVTHPERYRLL